MNRHLCEVVARSYAASKDLGALCSDIPITDYYTSELFSGNDYYGNAEQLKRFLHLPSQYPLKLVIQHGNQYGSFIWDLEAKAEFPVKLAWGSHVEQCWSKFSNSKIIKIGAPFFYTQGLLEQTEVEKEKKRLGKNLLVFPAHSMHHSTVNYDGQYLLDRLKDVAKNFDSIRVCIYWKDFLLGKHTFYQDAGYECVTAGHIFDSNFLPRHRSLLEVADASASNRIGSFLGYSIFLGKPHFYFDQTISVIDSGPGVVTEEEQAWRADPGVQRILKAFTHTGLTITEEQRASLEPYFGFKEVKTKKQLAGIIHLSEMLYKKIVR